MNLLTLRNFYFAILIITLSSCFPTQQIQLEDLSTELIELPFKIDSLTIVDGRSELLPMNIDQKVSSAKGTVWKGNPPLSDINRKDIEDIILRSENPTGVPVIMEFKVLEGLCLLNKNWQSPKEYAKFKGELTVNVPSRNYIYTSYAEMYYDNPNYGGSKKGALRLYNQAVKNVTHAILKQVRNEIKL